VGNDSPVAEASGDEDDELLSVAPTRQVSALSVQPPARLDLC